MSCGPNHRQDYTGSGRGRGCSECRRRAAREQAQLVTAARTVSGLTFSQYRKQYGQGRANAVSILRSKGWEV